ncbi:MAG: hypothetical protein IT239_03170 [Bacteroidia bacterium]|nr:hypothetical protein [Bacteroidia bacterium]
MVIFVKYMYQNKLKHTQIEKYFFLLILVLHLSPVISVKFFPTMDGAAHLYNAQLINDLLFKGNTFLANFFKFNTEPVPNWIGHIILLLCKLIMPTYLAEKVLLLLYLIGLPLAFRAFVKILSPTNLLLTYFMFPFTYSFVFLMGFFNFSIALMLLFITLTYWIKHIETSFTFNKSVYLFLLLTLTYFSHIFIFGILLFLISLYSAAYCLRNIINDPTEFNRPLVNLFKQASVLLAASFLPLTLFIYYFYSRGFYGNNTYIEFSELVEWLKDIRPIIAYNRSVEQVYTLKLVYLLFALSSIAFYNRINHIVSITKKQPFKEIYICAN